MAPDPEKRARSSPAAGSVAPLDQICHGSCVATHRLPGLARRRMIAIDILIEPDSRMMERAKSVNARLRRNYAEGFTFDESHVPHLTLVQRYVRADDVDALARALARYLRPGPMLPIDLQATGYEAASSDAIRTVVCLVERAAGLIHLASRA